MRIHTCKEARPNAYPILKRYMNVSDGHLYCVCECVCGCRCESVVSVCGCGCVGVGVGVRRRIQ